MGIRPQAVRARARKGALAVAIVEERVVQIPAIPFRGIDAFRYLDHPIFFAREDETRHLASLVSVYRGVMLYGDSGSGKSSLINAGLVPEAVRLGFQPERLRLQPRNTEELVVESVAATDHGADVLPSVLVVEDGDEVRSRVLSIDAFEQRVRAVSEQHRLLLIFDQFEELVTLFDETGMHEAQRGLVDMLVALLRGSLPVKVLLSFREDYLGRVKELLSQCPELVDQALRLAPPAADALPTIIRGPFERYPGHFDRELSPALADQLVAALAARFGAGEISLSEVQTVCLRLWQSDNPEVLLAEKGLQGLLEDYLGESLAALPPHLQPAAIALLGQMVTSAGTRNVISAEDLVQRVRDQESHISPDLLEQALDRLSQSRLVRRERRRDLYLYEITSEFLVPWISARRAEFRRLHERRRERRRLVVVGAIAGVLLFVAAAVTLLAAWAITQRNHARSEARVASNTARSQGLANAQARLGGRLDVGLLLSLESLRPYRATPLAAAWARSSMTAALEPVVAAQASGLLGIMHGHANSVYGVAFTPGGRTLASAGGDNTIRLWDVSSHKQLGPPLTGHTDNVNSVAFSPDGRTLASASNDETVRLWDVRTRRQLGAPLIGNGSGVEAVAFSPDGRMLATAGDDKTVRLWDVSTHRQVGKSLVGHRSNVRAVAFSPDGRTLASASYDATIRLWDVATHEQRGPPLIGHKGYVEDVAFSPDGRTIASGGDDATIRLWDVASGTQLGAPLKAHSDIVYAVAFSPDGRTLASGSGDEQITLWDVESQRNLRTLTGHTGTVYGVAFSPDGRTLASASSDDTVMLWSAGRGHVSPSLTGHRGDVIAVAFSPNGRMLASASADKTIRLWDVAARRQVGAPLTGHAAPVYALAFGPDGRTLASASGDQTVRLWDIAAGRQLGAPLTGHTDAVYGVAFSRDGRTLASVSADKTVRLWDVATRRQLGAPLRGHGDAVVGVAFSRDGRTVASASLDQTIRLWDVATHRQLGAPLTGHTGPVYAVAFSPDGRTLASGAGDRTVRLWALGTHRQLGAPMTGHAGVVDGVAFSPDGRTLASASDDSTIGLWDVATHVPLGSPLTGHDDTVYGVAFSPDGRTLASASADKTIRLWTGLFWGDFAELRHRVCSLVGSGLSETEWAQFAPGVPYQESCP